MICNILDNNTELYMIKYIIGEIFSSGGATLYKNPSDQTVASLPFHFWPLKMYSVLKNCEKNFGKKFLLRNTTYLLISNDGILIGWPCFFSRYIL